MQWVGVWGVSGRALHLWLRLFAGDVSGRYPNLVCFLRWKTSVGNVWMVGPGVREFFRWRLTQANARLGMTSSGRQALQGSGQTGLFPANHATPERRR